MACGTPEPDRCDFAGRTLVSRHERAAVASKQHELDRSLVVEGRERLEKMSIPKSHCAVVTG